MGQSQAPDARVTGREGVQQSQVESSPDLAVEFKLRERLVQSGCGDGVTSTIPLSPPVMMYSPSRDTDIH